MNVVASSVIAGLAFLAALIEYAHSRIRQRFRQRYEPRTHILPTTILPSLLPDEATVSTPLSAFDASRQEDSPTALLACVRLYGAPVSAQVEPAPRTEEEHRLHFARYLVRTGRLHEGDR